MENIKRIFILFFAALYLLAGNGVNFIDYCCNRCKDMGMEVLIAGCHGNEDQPCRSAHSSDDATGDCCDLTANVAHKCHLIRYTLDDGQELPSKFSLQNIMVAVVLLHFLPEITCPSITHNKNSFSTGFLHNFGRSLLSHICVLTI